MLILLVEDDEDHALLTEMAIRDAQPELVERLVVTTVPDGATALATLRDEAGQVRRELPDLVLLDLKMPEMDGLDVLHEIRADPRLRTIPVIVLTTSAHHEDVMAAYRQGANEYVTKPVQPEEFRTKVQAIPHYWSRIVHRPPRL